MLVSTVWLHSHSTTECPVNLGDQLLAEKRRGTTQINELVISRRKKKLSRSLSLFRYSVRNPVNSETNFLYTWAGCIKSKSVCLHSNSLRAMAGNPLTQLLFFRLTAFLGSTFHLRKCSECIFLCHSEIICVPYYWLNICLPNRFLISRPIVQKQPKAIGWEQFVANENSHKWKKAQRLYMTNGLCGAANTKNPRKISKCLSIQVPRTSV